jgi:TolB-like protein/Tfp pilus assembly protein PilF
MGVVYRAEDTRLGRKVAIKTVPAEMVTNRRAKERFLNEARAASALDHPNICTVYEIEETSDGQLYLTMPCYDGETLRSRLQRGTLPVPEAVHIALQAARGLAQAHQLGIVHCDVKPANLMLIGDGLLKVLDFGIARLSGKVSHVQAGPSGTPGYRSPEQERGDEVDTASDIWSLGVVLYEMVSGKKPKCGEYGEALLWELRGVPPELDRILSRMLAFDPADRYPHATALLADLQCLDGRIRELATKHRAGGRRQKLRTVGLGVVVVWALILGAYLALGRREAFSGKRPVPSSLRFTEPALYRATAPSLAVLPFRNPSGKEEYFAEGMTDALIASLGKIGRIRVISQQSVMKYIRSEKPLPLIARELGVNLIITGSVLRSGQKVRITIGLIQPNPEKQLWAENYKRDLQDVLALQDEVASQVAKQVRLELTDQERERLAQAQSVDPVAYDLYLQGRFHWNKRTAEELRKATEYFERAIARDPTFAAAYAGLADAHAWRGIYEYDLLETAISKARVEAMHALSLDRNLAEAHASLGVIKLFYDWDSLGAERELRRAVELNPSDAGSYQWLYMLLVSVGRLNDAEPYLQTARQLNPFSPSISSSLANDLLFRGDVDGAIEQSRKTIDLEPGYPDGYGDLWVALDAKGRSAEAFLAYEKMLSSDGHPATATLASSIFRRSGYHAALIAAGNALSLEPGQKDKWLIGGTFTLAGEHDKALLWLEKGMELRSPVMVMLHEDFVWKALRSEPRFQKLLDRLDRQFRDRKR